MQNLKIKFFLTLERLLVFKLEYVYTIESSEI